MEARRERGRVAGFNWERGSSSSCSSPWPEEGRILFGKDSRVDVSGLLATTTNILNENFSAGRYEFNIPSHIKGAAVVNQGEINIKDGGLLAFVSPWVENSGTISAQLSRVTLNSGDSFFLDLYGDKLKDVDTI